MTERIISDTFIQDLIEGKLSFFLNKVKENGSPFSIEIREGKINIYYRGGSLLLIEEKGEHEYKYKFDIKYAKRKDGQEIIKEGKPISEKKEDRVIPVHWSDFAVKYYDVIDLWDAIDYQEHFDEIRNVMDGWFDEHPKKEREYQHYVSLFNDNVIDIEYAIGENGMRLDMIMIKDGILYLIENKYGNSAISSASTKEGEQKPGLKKHYQDFINVVTQETLVNNIVISMQGIMKVKKKLGIMPNGYEIRLVDGKPQFCIMFVLANLTLSPKSKIIDNEIEEIEEIKTKRKDIIEKYPPYVLVTDSDEYVMNFEKAKPLLEFHL